MAPVSQKKLRLTALGVLFLTFLGGLIWLFLVGPFLNTHERWLMIARVATYTLGIPIALLTTKILRVKRTWDYVYNNLALWSFLLLVAFPSIYNGLISPETPYLNFWHVGVIWQIGLLLLAIFFMTSSFRLTQPIRHQYFPQVVILIHVLQLIFLGAVAFSVASTAHTLLADKRTIYILFLSLNIIQALLFFIAMVKQIITYNYRGIRVFFWNGLAAMAFFYASLSFALYNIGNADFLVLFYGFEVLGLLGLLLGLFNEQYRFLESETKLRESLERSLQETDQLLKSREIMLDEILVGIFMLDAHGVVVFANAHFCRLLKYDRTRFLGQNSRHFISNQSLEKFELEQQKWRENVSGQVELTFVGKSKSTIPMLMLTSPVFTRQRRYAGSRHAVIPIQRWKQIEKELRDRSQNLEQLVLERSADLQRKSEEQAFSKNYYEALIGGMREIMLVMNHTGKCTFLNRFGQEILGYTASELSNRNMPQFFLDFNHLRKEYGNSMNIEVRDYEQELRTRTGRKIVCSWNVQHLPDVDGKPMGIMFVGHDITDRQHLQRQLENQTHNLERLAEQRNAELNRKVSQLNKIIQIGEDIILNLDLNVILNNICEAIRTLGWQVVIIALRDFESNRINFVQAAGINEKKFSEISHQKRLDFKHLLSLMNDEYRISHSYFIDHSQKVFDFDRSQFSVFGRPQPKVNQWHANDALLVPIKIQSKILGFIIVQQPQYPTMPPDRDQTRSLEIFANKAAVVIENARLYREARQQAGEMKRLSQMKTEFLANMSHELRTPLNSVISMANFLLKGLPGKLNNEQQKQITIIEKNAKSLLGLINGLLDMSKIEVGQMDLQLSSFSIKSLVNHVFETIRPLCEEKSLDTEISLDRSLPEFILSDPGKISQILTNLLSNAVKYTESGKVTLTVHCRGNGQMLHIIIQDTGVGMSRADQLKIFESFVQLKQNQPLQAQGTGLGLAITQRLVDLLEGTIALKSRVGHGTTFTITLPVKPIGKRSGTSIHTTVPGRSKNNIRKTSAVQPDKTKKTARPQKDQPARVKRILIVDDNEDNRYAMTYLLQDRGFEIQLAENGKVGIDVAKKFHPDLILMDVMMPTMDGYTATRKLKQSTDFADTPIIAMTAKVMAYDHAKVLEAGYDDYIAKPFSMEKVIKKIEYWLEK